MKEEESFAAFSSPFAGTSNAPRSSHRLSFFPPCFPLLSGVSLALLIVLSFSQESQEFEMVLSPFWVQTPLPDERVDLMLVKIDFHPTFRFPRAGTLRAEIGFRAQPLLT